jgi:Cu(I)/Ag(I) efflux system membrane protein CusA/SilA
MLSTGIRTPIGIKISGSDLKKIEEIGIKIEKIIKDLKGTRSVYAERTTGGYFIDFNIKREVISRYGLSVKEVEDLLMTAIGGANLTTTIEGRERYGVLLRYPRDYRDNVEKLKKIVIPLENGMSVLLEQIADIELKKDPGMIRDENGLLTGYVYVDIKDVDIGSYVKNAKEELNNKLKLPPGYSITFSGQYENMLRVRERLKIVLPLTIFIIFILLYSNTKSIFKAFLVMLAVPFSIIGAIWFIYLLGYNISIAVWVGMIALMGLDAETGVFMLLYLDLAYNEFKKNGKLKNLSDLKEAIVYGAVKRVRPKMMTVMAAFMGLLPIMWSLGDWL